MKGCNSLRTVLAVIIYSIHFHLEMTVGHIKTRRYTLLLFKTNYLALLHIAVYGSKRRKKIHFYYFFALRTEIQKNKGTQNRAYIFWKLALYVQRLWVSVLSLMTNQNQHERVITPQAFTDLKPVIHNYHRNILHHSLHSCHGSHFLIKNGSFCGIEFLNLYPPPAKQTAIWSLYWMEETRS